MRHIGPRTTIDDGFSYDPHSEHITPTTPIPPVFQTPLGVAHAKALQKDPFVAYTTQVSVSFYNVKPKPSDIG